MKKRCRGFTLVEMMVVVAIIVIVVSTGIPGFRRIRDKSKQKICMGNLRRIKMAADQYRLDMNVAYANYVRLNDLWPDTVGVKKVDCYISQQLQCPVEGNRYVGNINIDWINDDDRKRIYVSTTLAKNLTGGPFCVVSPTNQIYDKAKGAEYAHYVQFLEQHDHLS